MLKNIFSSCFFVLDKILVKFALFLIRIYKLILSPYIGNNCRFTPTCSAYGKEAFLRYGFIKGSYLTLLRILKCNPWGGSGFDPVDKDK